MVEISKLKKFGPDCEGFHQDWCILLWWKNSTPESVVPLATSYFFLDCSGVEACCQISEQEIWIKGCKWDEKKAQLGEILKLKPRKRKLFSFSYNYSNFRINASSSRLKYGRSWWKRSGVSCFLEKGKLKKLPLLF